MMLSHHQHGQGPKLGHTLLEKRWELRSHIGVGESGALSTPGDSLVTLVNITNAHAPFRSLSSRDMHRCGQADMSHGHNM
jgi:hypothetical protein